MSVYLFALLLATPATAVDLSWTQSCILANATCVQDTQPALRLRAICHAFLYESHMVDDGCEANGFTCADALPSDNWIEKGMKKFNKVGKDGKCKPKPKDVAAGAGCTSCSHTCKSTADCKDLQGGQEQCDSTGWCVMGVGPMSGDRICGQCPGRVGPGGWCTGDQDTWTNDVCPEGTRCKSFAQTGSGFCHQEDKVALTSTAAGWCTKNSPLNPCKTCTTETDCNAHPDGKTWYCQAAQDPACGSAPISGWCTQDSPKKACDTCTTETDCNDHPDGKTWHCQQAKDPKCGGTKSGFCLHTSPKNACQPCGDESGCGHTPDGKTFFCQLGKDPQCGGPAPKGWCAHWATQNSCRACSSDEDCGNEKNACWGSKDTSCPSDAHILV